LGVGSRSPAAWPAREIELQALASAQISSAAHFLKSHQLFVQKFAADRSAKIVRQRSSLSTRDRVAGAGFGPDLVCRSFPKILRRIDRQRSFGKDPPFRLRSESHLNERITPRGSHQRLLATKSAISGNARRTADARQGTLQHAGLDTGRFTPSQLTIDIPRSGFTLTSINHAR
jgi:hypothetical protein